MFGRKHNTNKPILLSDTNSLGHFGESSIPILLSNNPPILPSTPTLYNQPLLKPHPSMLFPSNYLPYSTPFYSLLIHQPTLYIDCTPLSRCKDALCLGPHLLFLQQQALHTPSSLYPCSIRYSLYSCRGDHHSIVGLSSRMVTDGWTTTLLLPFRIVFTSIHLDSNRHDHLIPSILSITTHSQLPNALSSIHSHTSLSITTNHLFSRYTEATLTHHILHPSTLWTGSLQINHHSTLWSQVNNTSLYASYPRSHWP